MGGEDSGAEAVPDAVEDAGGEGVSEDTSPFTVVPPPEEELPVV